MAKNKRKTKPAFSCCITPFEDALLIVRTRKDVMGNHYNDIGVMNQACWIGEHSGILIYLIKRHRETTQALIDACLSALEHLRPGHESVDLMCSKAIADAKLMIP